MYNFKLYIINNEEQDILLTSFNSSTPELNNGPTFDEHLSEEQNDRYELTFKITAQGLAAPFNPASYLKIGRKLKLVQNNDYDNYILFIITSFTPEGSADNIIYTIGASDYVSYKWTRNNVGFTFNSLEDEEYLNNGLEHNAFQLAQHILKKGNLQRNFSGDFPEEGDEDFESIQYLPSFKFEKTGSMGAMNYNIKPKIIAPDYNQDDFYSIDINFGNYIIKKVSNGWVLNFKKLSFSIYVSYNVASTYFFTIGPETFFTMGDDDTFRSSLQDFAWVEIPTGAYTDYKLTVNLANFETFIEEIPFYNPSETPVEQTGLVVNRYFNINRSPFVFEQADYTPIFNINVSWFDIQRTETPSQSFYSYVEEGESFKGKSWDSLILIKYRYYYDYDTSQWVTDWNGPTSSWLLETYISEGQIFQVVSNVGGYGDWTIHPALIVPPSLLVRDIRFFYKLQDGSWQVNPNTSIKSENINIDISNSNTYNALIEIANITNTFLKIDYLNQIIDFIPRDSDVHRKGLILSPTINLQDLSLNYDGNDFFSVMHVRGGEDEYGLAVGLIPLVPQAARESLLVYQELEGHPNNPEPGISPGDNTFYSDLFYGKSPTSSKEPWWFDTNPTINFDEWEENKNFVEIADKVPYLDSFVLNLDYFRNNNLMSETIYNEIFNEIYNKLRKINLEYQYLVGRKYRLEWEIQQTENKILAAAELLPKAEDFNLLKKDLENLFFDEASQLFPYFNNMKIYNGLYEIRKRQDNYKKTIINYIRLRDIAREEIERYSVSSVTEDEIILANAQSDFDGYSLLVGNWTVDVKGDLVKGTEYGVYCYIYETFEKYYNLYIQQTVTVQDYYFPILQQFNNVVNKKEVFWFDFKSKYGKYWIEGFYENDLEVDPINLYNQAMIYLVDYKNPQENYNMTYIDISDILGANAFEVKAGDIIKLGETKKLGVMTDEKNEIQITSVERNLRSAADISLGVNKVNYTNQIIEKLLLGLK